MSAGILSWVEKEFIIIVMGTGTDLESGHKRIFHECPMACSRYYYPIFGGFLWAWAVNKWAFSNCVIFWASFALFINLKAWALPALYFYQQVGKNRHKHAHHYVSWINAHKDRLWELLLRKFFSFFRNFNSIYIIIYYEIQHKNCNNKIKIDCHIKKLMM